MDFSNTSSVLIEGNKLLSFSINGNVIWRIKKSWDAPEEDGDALIVRQVYSATEKRRLFGGDLNGLQTQKP